LWQWLRKRKAEITRTCYKHSRERENGFSFRCRPRPQPTSPALSLPEFSGRWAVGGGRWALGVGFVLRFAEDKLTNAETYRMPSIIVH